MTENLGVLPTYRLGGLETEKNEHGLPRGAELTYRQTLLKHGPLTLESFKYQYKGSGTVADPYEVVFPPGDPVNPYNYSIGRKWFIVSNVALATLAITFASSAYAGGVIQLIHEFHCSREVAVLGVSLFVLGFALGPLIWAPGSEMFGRQILFLITYGLFFAFNAAAAGAPDMATLLVLRFFAGVFGSSPLTNAGGVISDMFFAEKRGLALSVFALMPFAGPVLGPIVGGFTGQYVGWRWVMGVIAIFSGVVWIFACLSVPETFAPILLKNRAHQLSKLTGKVYKSQQEIAQGQKTATQLLGKALTLPWILLAKEPIVLVLSIYMAIVYGTLYMTFGAFPIVFQQNRGWSQGIGGLSFIGVFVGMMGGIILTIFWDNPRYVRVSRKFQGFAPPEQRLMTVMIAAPCIPIGLIIFAWTNFTEIHWIVSMIFTAPFGFGMVLVFLGIMNYLIDAYTIYAASVLAANSVLRSIFGAAFPLFTGKMYENLGIHWASSVPAFLGLACLPFPFLFYKYGPQIREKCKYAGQSAAFMHKLVADMNKLTELPADTAMLAAKKEEVQETEAVAVAAIDETPGITAAQEAASEGAVSVDIAEKV